MKSHRKFKIPEALVYSDKIISSFEVYSVKMMFEIVHVPW